MRLRNHTNIPAGAIRAMVRFVVPSGVAGFDVRVSNLGGSGVRGRAYHHGCSLHDRACPFVVVSVQRKGHLAPWTPTRGGYLPMPAMTREEGVLFVLAHELRHMWQSKVKHGRRVYGARGQFSERDADAYALRALRHWRRGEAMP